MHILKMLYLWKTPEPEIVTETNKETGEKKTESGSAATGKTTSAPKPTDSVPGKKDETDSPSVEKPTERPEIKG